MILIESTKMADRLPPRPTDPDDREIADIGELLDEPDPARPAPKRPAVKPQEDLDGYEVEDLDLPAPKTRPTAPRGPAESPKPSPSAPRGPAESSKPRPPADEPMEERTPRRPSKKSSKDKDLDALAEESTVDPVWSRNGEWGGTIALLAVVGIVVLGVVYWLMASGQVGLGIGALLLGLVVLVLLSYPIAVTMEVPVRMTPERALKDYYAALSHHFPHYKRMWLLLSDLGRDSAEFVNYSEFRESWRERLAGLRKAGAVKKATPLEFEVIEFNGEKSAGKDANAGHATVQVSARGGAVISTSTYAIGFARGPDRMWYLNRGDLPAS